MTKATATTWLVTDMTSGNYVATVESRTERGARTIAARNTNNAYMYLSATPAEELAYMTRAEALESHEAGIPVYFVETAPGEYRYYLNEERSIATARAFGTWSVRFSPAPGAPDGTYRLDNGELVALSLEDGYQVGAPGGYVVTLRPRAGQIAAWAAAVGWATFGIWTDPTDGRIYVDPCEHVADRAAALELARERGELAIWDWVAGESVSVSA